MDNVLELSQIWAIIRKHLALIISLGILLAVVAFGVAQFGLTPKYAAQAQLLVNRKADANNQGATTMDQQADVNMINTYKDIITSPVILTDAQQAISNPDGKTIKPAVKAKYKKVDGKKVLVQAGTPAVVEPTAKPYDVSVGEMQSDITITNQQNSQVFAINVTTTDPDKAVAIANGVANIFKEKISQIMSINNVTIVSEATPNPNRVSPNVKLIAAAGLVLGLFIGLAIAFLRELTDKTVKDLSYLTEELGMTNLGVVNYVIDLKVDPRPSKQVAEDAADDSASAKRI